MKKEQVIRSEPPPSVINDNKSAGGELFYQFPIKQLAFWMERAAGFLVVFCVGGTIILNLVLNRSRRVPSDIWVFLSPACVLLIISNILHISSYIYSQVIQAKPHPPSVASDNKSRGGGGELIKQEDAAFWSERLAVFFVFLSWVSSYEFWQQWFCVIASWLFIVSNVTYIRCYLYPQNKRKRRRKSTRYVSLKESKDEEKALAKRNNKGKETTGQQKAKLEVSLKESKEEVRSNSEEFQSVEAKYLDTIEKKVDQLQKSFDKFHGWEEERSQLMYELGAAKALFEMYRDLLHNLHYDQP